jgi:predicted nucleotidyltransferase
VKKSAIWKKFKARLQSAAREKDLALRGVKIAAVISRALQEIGIDPILVGGSAVAFYTEGKYTTHDIDMISPSGKETDEIMKQLGFTKYGKDYSNEKLKIYVEFPGDALGPTEKINIIKTGGVKLKIISLEDLIVDRLCAFKYWRSSIDGLNALMMIELGIADRKRVEDRAREEDVLDALDFVEDILEKIIRRKLPPAQASELLASFHRRRP